MALRILLADASMTAQKLGTTVLAAAGYDVVTVNNGLAAIKKIAELHPDVVLLDVFMAGYGGVEVCKKMKATAETARMPILLTVGKMEPFDAGEAIIAKADGLVIKPFESKVLIAAVEKAAGSSRPPEPATSPRVIVDKFQITKEEAGGVQARSEQKPPQSAVAKAVVHALAGPESSETCQSALVSHRGKTSLPAFSQRQAGEVCDVCGHLNRVGTYACQQCDVPLPSSLRIPEVRP